MIVFLDFDGLLHPLGASVDRLFDHAEMLATSLHQQPGIQLVISRSRRETHCIEHIREMLFHSDPSLQARVIGVTPLMSRVLNIDFERSAECRAWLVDNGHDFTAWVVRALRGSIALGDFSGLEDLSNKAASPWA